MKRFFKTMAFTLLGLVLSVNLMADSYTITFATGSGDGTSASTSTACSTVVSDGSNYLSGNLATATKVYYSGGSGLKLGASSNAGTIKMNLSTNGQVTPTSIVVNAKLYNSGKATTLKVNGSATQNLAADFADYTFNITSKITDIELVTSKYAWISSVTVNYEGTTPSKTLTAVTVSGTPTKTTYNEGESFDPAGLTVTGTYDDASEETITSDITWSYETTDVLAKNQTSINVKATVDEVTSANWYTVSGLTVNAHQVTPGTYEISLNNALYGIETGNNGTEQSVKKNDITIVSGCTSSATSKTYYDANHIRYYTDSYLKLSVPAGYLITSVVFAEPSSSKNWSGSITSTPDSYNANTKTWTGQSQNVDFAFGAQNRAAKITVTFAAPKVVSGIAVKTNPTKTTYYVGDEFDPAGLVITASYDSGDPEDIAYSDANKDAFSFSGFNSAAEATDQVITVTYAEKTATFTVNIEEARVLNSIEVASNPTKMVYEVGEALDLTGLVVNGIYSTGDPEAVGYTASPADGAILDAVGNTTVTLTSVDNTELTTSFDVTVTAPVGDKLTPALVGNKSSYAQWDNAYVGTYATYIGYAMGGDAKFQLKSSDNVAGIVSTVSGGNIAKVKVTWNSSTTSGRVLDVYGSNTAYTAASDLYDDSKKGTKIGSIKYNESSEFIVSEGEYAYVGIRSASGALYLDNVTFIWSAPKVLEGIAVKTAPKTTYNAGESFDPTGLVITATYDDESTKDITYDANDTKWEFAPGLTDKLDATDEEVIISYDNVICDDALTITVNRVASNLAAVSATKIVIVDDMPDLSEWYTIDANYDGTVAFSSNKPETFDVEEGTGLALDEGSATLTITAPQTNTYAEASVTIEVTVNAAAVPCSVTWMNNGEEYTAGEPSTTVNAGQKVTKLPTAPTPCDAQHVFKGWTNAAIATPQADAPEILFTDAASAPTVDADGTIYYAVYAVESPGSDVLTKMVVGNTLANGDKIVIVAHKDGDLTDDVAMYQETVSSSYVNKYAFDGNINSVLANNKNWLTVNTKEGGFSLGDATNGYIYSSSNNLYCGETAQVWTLNDLEDGTFKLQSDGRNLSYRHDLSSPYWRMGGASYGTSGQTVLDIYKIEAGDVVCSDYSTTCAAIELDAIELSGTYPTTFLAGDAFSHEGMTVTASYTNSTTTKNVTNLATFSGYNANTLGEQTVTVSYTEGEGESAITKTTTYNVTVNDLPNKTIQEFIAAQGTKCYLTAIVSNLDGNQYDLTDNSGTIHGYKYTLATGVSALANGDRIRVRAEEYEYYQSKTHEVKNIVVLEKLAFSAIAVSGTMSVTEYTEGNTLNSEGLVVKGKYADEDEAKHVITEGITWNMPTAVLGTSEYDVTATVGTLTSPAYHVTGITVNAAKVLTGIAITTEPKKTFWVGEYFSTEGIQVTASYDGAADDDVTTLCTFSRAETQITDAIENETITVSYTEGTETKTATYTINANWMTLADLVAKGQPSTDAVKVWVKVTDAEIKAKSYSYITTDVIYGDNQTQEVKIYQNGVSNDWEVKGKISGELKDVDWKLYGSDWELMPSDWSWATYTPAPKIDVTGVTLNETAIELKAGKTATLVATVAPDNATDKSVTWAIVNDNANGKISVDQTGLVIVAADAVVGATADVQVTTTDGGFTATCTVTVVAGPSFNNGIWQKVVATTELNTANYYIIASDNYDFAMKSYTEGNNCSYVTIEKDGDILTYNAGTAPAIFALEEGKNAQQWALYDIEIEKYLFAAGSGTNNYLKAQESKNDDKASWKITFSDGKVGIQAASSNRNTMSFNNSNNPKIFSCYSALQSNGQLALYKYVEGAYVISFDANGGDQNTVPDAIVTNEGKANIPASVPTHETRGNVFAYWTVDQVGTGTHYTAGQENCEFSANTTLYAQWQVMSAHHITYVSGGAGGTLPVDEEDYYLNDEVTLASASTLSNPGYIFAGWEVTYNDGEVKTLEVNNNKFTMPDYDVTATAKWALKTNDKWVLVTDASQLVAGDKYVLACNSKAKVNGNLDGAVLTSKEATFSEDKQVITAMSDQLALTLGGSIGAWTFANEDGYLLGATEVKKLTFNNTAQNYVGTWSISISDDCATITNTGSNYGTMKYNNSSPRFTTYASGQEAVQLYRLIPAQVIDEEVNASTLDDHADVTVNEGGNLVINEDVELGDIVVAVGGTVTLETNTTLTVNNFVIKSTMAGGESGQVLGVTSTNFVVTGDAYYDVVLGDNANPNKWHAFAVPFNVDAINGVYDLDDNKLTNEVNYAIMDYHGDVRAQGNYGWKKFSGIMNPGVFYLMTVDGQRTTYRMKMNGGFHASSSTITVNQYASVTTTDAGWNGIANNQLNYVSVDAPVQVLNPVSYTFVTMTESSTNFTVGTPFFYQAGADGSVDLTAPNAGENYAPRRVGATEAKNIAVTLGNNDYTDRLYISATDEATNAYQIGRDLAKMTMTSAPAVPQIFAEAYGTKLSMIDVPMVNDQAIYALNLYAPANGEYTMGAAQVEGYEVFLTQYGNVIWNLSMSEAMIELTKGNNTEYGLILKATGAHAPTDINTLKGQESVQKFFFNSNIYIRHNNKTYGVTGQLVK